MVKYVRHISKPGDKVGKVVKQEAVDDKRKTAHTTKPIVPEVKEPKVEEPKVEEPKVEEPVKEEGKKKKGSSVSDMLKKRKKKDEVSSQE